LPISVVIFSNNNVNKLNEGDPLAKGTSLPTDFWDFLETWGGMWMWEGNDETQPTKHDLTWLVEGMKSNTLVWVIDGSNDWKKAADLSRVGWIIFCSKTGLRLTCTFWKKISSGKFISGGNAWLMHPAPLFQSAFRVPQDSGVESYIVL
jgi:hypothetical protein